MLVELISLPAEICEVKSETRGLLVARMMSFAFAIGWGNFPISPFFSSRWTSLCLEFDPPTQNFVLRKICVRWGGIQLSFLSIKVSQPLKIGWLALRKLIPLGKAFSRNTPQGLSVGSPGSHGRLSGK